MAASPGIAVQALLLAVAMVQIVSQSCHADLLMKGINYAALSQQEQQAVGQTVSAQIAAETGMAAQDVMCKIFAGNYNAAWSPSQGRPPADAFLASLVNKCGSAEMVLGVFRGPQLQSKIVSALQSALANSGALTGTISIIGASVVPEQVATPTPAPSLPIPQPGGQGPLLPGTAPAPAVPAPALTLPGPAPAPSADSGGGGSGGLVVLAGVLLLAAVAIPVAIKMKQQHDDDDEERYAFTGH